MKRETLLIGLIVLLVLLNAFVLFRSSRPPRPPHDKIIVETLRLDEQQQREFEKLKFEHRTGINAIERKVESALEQYFLLLNDEDDSKKDSLETILGNLEKQKAALTYKHFTDLKSLCRPDQKKEFEAFIPQLSRFILPQGPQHPNNKPPF